MLLHILLKSIGEISTEFDIPEENMVSLFTPCFQDSKKKFIYPEAASKKLSIGIERAFVVLNTFQKKQILKRVYEFRCPDSDYKKIFTGMNYINLPEKIICEDCGEEFALRDNLYVIYEVDLAKKGCVPALKRP